MTLAAPARSAVASLFPRPVCLLATGDIERVHVITVTAVTVVAVEPTVLAVSVDPNGRFHALAVSCGSFVVGLLGAHQASLAERFARPYRDVGPSQLTGLRWRPGPVSRTPVVEEVLAWFDCTLAAHVEVPSGCVLTGVAVAHSAPPPEHANALLRVRGHYLPVPSAPDHPCEGR